MGIRGSIHISWIRLPPLWPWPSAPIPDRLTLAGPNLEFLNAPTLRPPARKLSALSQVN